MNEQVIRKTMYEVFWPAINENKTYVEAATRFVDRLLPRIKHDIAKDVEEKVRRIVYLLDDCNISRERAVEAICIFIAGNTTELPGDVDDAPISTSK
jgi:hypothetical protein